MERVVCEQLTDMVAHNWMIPVCLYKLRHGVEDASLGLLDMATKNLDSVRPHTWI